MTRGIGTRHLEIRTLPSSTSKLGTLPRPHSRRRTITPLRCPEPLPPSDRRPLGLLPWNPIAGRRDGGDGPSVRDFHAVLVGIPAFAWVGLLVVLPLLASGIDAPFKVVGEGWLAPPVVLVGGLGEAVGPLRGKFVLDT